MLFYSIPTSVMNWMNPDWEIWRTFRIDIRKHVRRIKEEISSGAPKLSQPDRATVFSEILTNPNLPEAEKDAERLSREAQVTVQAGIETVSWSLTTNLTYLLSTPSALNRLHAELAAAIPTASAAAVPGWPALEQLPYLSACVHEGLRLGYGVVTRLARVPQDEPLAYAEPGGRAWSIPPGTPSGVCGAVYRAGDVG
ncbi:putative cytochrome p450 protein [Neofusicoccum parvum UCRNP2]|uniref:Putative cytochrome p450 protein n=1 Tax=Botryosphaeria parva (strain UCR-NP2) TaxID=1287680 RepID=R1EML1_BOTPV|nr:putative cytochrome p450 protein [Neofusicoccum parvum UCRNP2]